jgi:tRNA pseudouridine13 synthase
MAKQTPTIHPNLTAWQNLPAKLVAEDEAASAALEQEKLTAKPVNPDEIKQPIYRETFVETTLIDNEGQRTGHRSTKYIGADGKEVSKEEADAVNEANAKITESSKATDVTAMANVTKPAVDNPWIASPEPASNWSQNQPALGTSSANVGSLSLSMDGAADEYPENKEPAKIGLIIKFKLGPSMYATMALRELMKAGGVKTYKPEFSTGA